MNRWLWILAALALAGCASDGYRYYDDGYYAAERAPARSLVISGSFSACTSWGRPYAYPYYGYGYGHGWAGCGYGYGPAYGYGYGYGYGGWYGGAYWGYPYGSGGWHPPHAPGGPAAGPRARQMAGESADRYPAFPRYEDLAPSRDRDTGGGNRAWQSTAPRSSYPSYYQRGSGSPYGVAPAGLSGGARQGAGSSGLSGSLRFDSSSMPEGSRSDFGPRSGFGDSGPSSSGSLRSSDSMRSSESMHGGSAASEARSISRERQDEE